MSQNYSVLMSVYYKEHPDYLRQSMQSIYDQTVPTDNFALVCDGPLNPPLDEVIVEMQEKFGDRLYIHRLAKNGGLGNALNEGMKYCKNEYIARMDSDDISRNDRCEKELNYLEAHREVSIVGGIIEEFIGNVDCVCSKRICPEFDFEIRQFARKRNPFNHVSVMYRKQDVEKSGSYQSFFLLEDYYLWIRMFSNGFKGYNIQSPLVWVRVGKDMYARRGGWKYVESQYKLLKYMRQINFITKNEFLMQSVVRMIGTLIPGWMRGFIYRNFLRK
jgi:glycosyltransferase involved in cell wall biosynthesis